MDRPYLSPVTDHGSPVFPPQGADPACEGGRERSLPAGGEQVGPGGPAAGQRRGGQGPRRAVGRLLRGDVRQNPCQRRQGESPAPDDLSNEGRH